MKRFLGIVGLLGLLIWGGSLAPIEAENRSERLRVCREGCPYQHIQSAVDAARTGDEISVAPGRYQENLLITKSLTISGTTAFDQVVVEANESGKPTVQVLNPDRQLGSLPVQVKLQSLTITGARPATPNDPCAGDKTGLCTGLYIESSSVKMNTSTGQVTSYLNAVNVILVDVQVTRNTYNGIQMNGQVNLVLINSRISENGLFGLTAANGPAQVALYDSEVVGNKYDGVHLWSSASGVIFSAFDSRFIGNGSVGIEIEEGSCAFLFNFPFPSSLVNLQRVIIRGNNRGISLQASATLNISDSIIEENGLGVHVHPARCGSGLSQLSISRVRVMKNEEGGILVIGSIQPLIYLTDSIIAENGRQLKEFSDLGGPGIGFLLAKGVQSALVRNEIRGNAGYGIKAEHPENIGLCSNNKVFDNGLGSYDQAAAQKCK